MNVQEEARRRWDSVAKPLHSLGLLEDLVVRIAGIQGTENVCIDHRCALVFCGDHGVVRQGVSQTDSSVTALVAKAIGEGTGNINLMAAEAHTDVLAVDMGMLKPVPGTVDRHAGRGTADMTEGPAMTRAQAEEAIRAGMEQMKELHETLERHEREISKLVRNQEAASQQDLPKEVIRQLNSRLRMERLRGGL